MSIFHVVDVPLCTPCSVTFLIVFLVAIVDNMYSVGYNLALAIVSIHPYRIRNTQSIAWVRVSRP